MAQYQGDWFKPQHKKRTDLLPGQAEFIEWLVNPNKDPGTMTGYAQVAGVALNTLGKWKRDPVFQKHWSRRCIDEGIDPTRIKDVIDAMFVKAKGGDTQAAKLVLAYVEKATPWSQTSAAEIEDNTPVTEMSDDELIALLGAEE